MYLGNLIIQRLQKRIYLKKDITPYAQDEQENIIHDEEEIGSEQNINPQHNNINLLHLIVINAMMGNLNANNDEILNNI